MKKLFLFIILVGAILFLYLHPILAKLIGLLLYFVFIVFCLVGIFYCLIKLPIWLVDFNDSCQKRWKLNPPSKIFQIFFKFCLWIIWISSCIFSIPAWILVCLGCNFGIGGGGGGGIKKSKDDYELRKGREHRDAILRKRKNI